MAPARKKQRLSNGSAELVDTVVESETPKNEQKTTESAAKEAKTPDDQHKRSLFVRSLPATTTSESLTELFSESYPVKHAVAVLDPATKQCRGFGFVTFADVEDAQKAKKEFNGHTLEGRKLRVEIAERRQREGEDGAAPGEAKAKREKEKAESHQAPRLIVRNLPWTIKHQDQLVKLFQMYGKVKQAYLPKKSGGLLAGFGFVLMRGRKNAEKAIEGVNGKEIDGRTIAVDWAVAKETYERNEVDETATAHPTEQADDDENDEEGGVNVEDMDADADKDMLSDDDEDNSDEQSEGSTGATSADLDAEPEEDPHRKEDKSSTLFVRNLPFTCTDEDLEDHFSQFGATRYARVVLDYQTGRPKGTGFVCFYEQADAEGCLREAPRSSFPGAQVNGKPPTSGPSILQNTSADPTGKFTLDGRVLQVSKAVEKSEANRLTDEGNANRTRRDRDKRRLYLLSEGSIATNTKLWESLPPSEQTMREASIKQRKNLIESNPSLNLSLTRLSIRNIPRSITSKDLKQLAREAVVGFATEVKEGKRQRLSKEELERSAEEMQAADDARKASGKGIVRQAKVVFEGESGGKVSEDTGAGRSRGYGFIEYYTHRSALMGLRWLNGHAVGYQVKDAQGKGKASAREAMHDKKKRLIVEFAIENAQVVQRRQDREQKARERSRAVQEGRVQAGARTDGGADGGVKKFSKQDKNFKRKRMTEDEAAREKGFGKKGKDFKRKKLASGEAASADGKGKTGESGDDAEDKLAKRNRIIGRKRQLRRARQGGKK